MSENSIETVYQGDTFRSYTVAELNNVPHAADATPVVVIYNPSGVLVVSGEATAGTPDGVYYQDYPTTTASPEGVWRAEWAYAVSGQAFVNNDYFKVTTPVSTSGQQYCTASEIRELTTGLDLTALTDAQLNVWSIRLSELIDNYCMRRFGSLRVTEQKDGIRDHLGRLFFYADNLPITTVHGITLNYIGQTASISLDPEKVNWFYTRGYGRYDYEPTGDGTMLRSEFKADLTYEIDYTGGGSVPQGVKLALALMFENVYQPTLVQAATGESAGLDNSGSNRTLKGYKSGTYSVTYDQGTAEAMFSLNTGKIFTATVRDLLNHHRKAGQSLLS